MIRNRYNQIPYPDLNTKRERDTYNLDGTKIKTAQVKNQGDSAKPFLRSSPTSFEQVPVLTIFVLKCSLLKDSD